MTETARALQAFWAGFGLPAYPEDDVPDDSTFPYITYTVVEPDWRQAVTHQARVWYYGSSYTELYAKVDEIHKAIGAGKLIKTADGYICLYIGDPFAQRMAFDQSEIKCMYLNFQLNSYQI